VTATKTGGSDAISSGYRHNGAFFPASGYRISPGKLSTKEGMSGDYWSSSPYSATNGYNLYFTDLEPIFWDNPIRLYGFSVRCVVQ
jgi:hypothetical protein